MSDLCHNCGDCHLPTPCKQPLFYCTLCANYGHQFNFCPTGVHRQDPSYRFWMLCHSCDIWHLPEPCKIPLHKCTNCSNLGHMEIFCPIRPLSRLRPSTFDTQEVIDKATGYKRQRTISSSAEGKLIEGNSSGMSASQEVLRQDLYNLPERFRTIKVETAQQIFDWLNEGFSRDQILAFVARPLSPTTSVTGAEKGTPDTSRLPAHGEIGLEHPQVQVTEKGNLPQHVSMQFTDQAQLALHSGYYGHVYDKRPFPFTSGDLRQPRKDSSRRSSMENSGESAHVINGQNNQFHVQAGAASTGLPVAQCKSTVLAQRAVTSQCSLQRPQTSHEPHNMHDNQRTRMNNKASGMEAASPPYGAVAQTETSQILATPNEPAQEPARSDAPTTGRESGSKRCADCQQSHKRCIHIVKAGQTPHRIAPVNGQPAMPSAKISASDYHGLTPDQWVNNSMQTLSQMPGADPQDPAPGTNNISDPNLDSSLAALLHNGGIGNNHVSTAAENEGQMAYPHSSEEAAATGTEQASQNPAQQALTSETFDYDAATNQVEQDQVDELASADNPLEPEGTKGGAKRKTAKAAPKKRGSGRKRSKSSANP